MPIRLENTHVIDDEIERLSYNDDHSTTCRSLFTSAEQDFSFLNKSSHIKRSVHYDIEPLNNHEHQSLRSIGEIEQPSIDTVLRRRYIAHWGLPGNY